MTAKTSSYIPALKGLAIAVYICCLLLIAACAFRRPHYNWDMLAYMALVIKMEHKDPRAIHQFTYSIAKEEVPEREYNLLLAGAYREKMAENPAEFYNQLPVYAAKPLYVWLSYLFYKAGFSLPLSTVLPSVIAYILIGLLLFHWLSRHLPFVFAFAASLFIIYANFMVTLARASTPDCLSTFVMLSAFYFIIEKPSIWWMSLLMILSIFARLDNIVAWFWIISFLFFIKKWTIPVSWKQYFLLLSVLLLCYFAITLSFRSYGWDAFYYSSFSMRQLNLAREYQAVFSWKAYMSFAISMAIGGLVYNHFVFFMLLLLLVVYFPGFRIRKLNLEQSFCFLFPLIIATRFVLLPELSDRYYMAFYLCIVMVLIKRVGSLAFRVQS